MPFLILILMGGFLYMLVQSQDIRKQVMDLLQRVQDLENQLRRLHVKIVNQLPGFIDEGAAQRPLPSQEPVRPAPTPAPEPIEQPTAPDQKVFTPSEHRPPILPPEPVRPGWRDFTPSPSIDWENFMGVKLFAWLGGFALFLGMAFFVKYSIEHDLISPQARVMIGFIIGVGVIFAGLWIRPKGYAVTVQTLCAAGISILYADIFACRSFYNFLSPEVAFPLMTLVTVVSFLLAVQLDSRYVAVLGLVGGFLTPILLSTGVDHPIGLFSYIALLDTGLIAVSIKKRWGFLMGMSAAATLFMQIGWTFKFFTPEKAEIGFGIFFLFGLFYVLAAEIADHLDAEDAAYHVPGGLMPLFSMGFVGYMLTFQALAIRPGLVLTLLLLLSLELAYMAIRFDDMRPVYILGGVGAFLLLMGWTMGHMKSELLLWGMGYYMAFAIVHTALPIVLQKIKPSATPFLWGYMAPILMLVLILFAMIFCDILSFVMWPFVFLIGMIAVAVAWLAGSILAAGASLALIMASFGVWLFRLPDVGGLPGILTLLAFFACAFFAWSLLVTRKASLFSGDSKLSMAKGISPEEAAQLPAFSALMPFALIAMVCIKLKMADPSQVFGLMLLLGVLLLGLVRYRAIDLVSLVALLCTGFVEYLWHTQNFNPQQPSPAVWYLVFYGVYLIFPFLFQKRLKGTIPWVASALSGPVHFWMVYNATAQTIGKGSIGLIPALFAGPTLLGLYYLIGSVPKTDELRNSLLAWFGGASLFFVTLVIPIQFDKEWLTLGWALEGAALLWLFQRVPHEGLKGWAITLLTIAFVRLAINPSVLAYHPRTGTPLFNWYLLVYGVSALSYFAAAQWLKPPKNMFMENNMPPFLNSLGTVLLFILLNIEISDYFSTGSTITFNFSSSFAQDLTYSLGWAVFAIAMLIAGIRHRLQGARYASLGLLTVTIIKVFLHDLWRLGQLFRVASFVGLAVILILVSFLYQRFVAQDKPQEGRRA